MTKSPAPIILVSGTGTGIGKTHFADAVTRRLARTQTVTGWKPVESGAAHAIGEDQARLTSVSSKDARVPSTAHLALDEGVSPHLASERAGAILPWDNWMQFARSFARGANALVVELAGGLFSPLSITEDNASFVRRFREEAVARGKLVLCAPDRLGVLHDVRAVLLATTHLGLPVDAIVLIAPAEADASSGTNRRELERTLAPIARGVAIFGPLPRLASQELADHPHIEELVGYLSRVE